MNPQPLTIKEARVKFAALSQSQSEHERERMEAARALAEAEREYRRERARRILELHAEGTAWTVCDELAKGDIGVSDKRYIRDVAKGALDACTDAAYRLAADRRALEEIVRWSAQIDIRALSATGGEENTLGNSEKPTMAETEKVYDAWVMATGRTSKTRFDTRRRAAVCRALTHYPLDDVLDAVKGWRRSPHHCGENDTGTVYNDLTLLLRNGENIEKFRDLERQSETMVNRSSEVQRGEALRVKYGG